MVREIPWGVQLAFEVAVAGLGRGQAAERVFAARPFVEHAGHAVDIRTGRPRLALEQFGGGVAGGPGVEAVAAQVWQAGQDALLGLAQTEVEQAHAFFAEHHVARFHVTVQHAASVGEGQRVEQRQRDVAQFFPRQTQRPLAE
ncbi:hypothetical protein PS861_06315 [Pseudomonas fluorescens]|nr:hypothetical protein PS861_06315 [Pseudomonas fluorescens]